MPDKTGDDGKVDFGNRRRAGIVGLFAARIKPLLCLGCDECLAVCKYGVFRRRADGKVEAKSGHQCAGCLKCIGVCRTKAIQIQPGKGFCRSR